MALQPLLHPPAFPWPSLRKSLPQWRDEDFWSAHSCAAARDSHPLPILLRESIKLYFESNGGVKACQTEAVETACGNSFPEACASAKSRTRSSANCISCCFCC